ncbi:unnamed protein product [Rotaria socialis]|uniref:nitric oxide dioxygenase n=1 Tax=Rotaria socialis TaxID=392032 RepID=A0A818C6A2_9BILA|nr:unnamed protein product [Rotaria socialis]CAF4373068.1 unnamed protein product [Rotaria socialis]
MVLTDEQKKIVQSTAPVLKEHGKQITSVFYQHVQEAHPELRNIFNQSNQTTGSQPLALAFTLYCAAEHINHLDVLMPQVEQIAYKHRALLVKPEHYPIVGKFLLEAIAEVLGAKATPEILEAWKAAYSVISSIFIGLEKKLYAKLGDDERDKGFISFKIVSKETVAAGPTVALTLERADGGKLFDYIPGQYIAVRLEKGGLFHNRLYGLTEPSNGKTYSIVVKQEADNAPNATISNEIINNLNVGGTILATNPSGNFTLVNDAKHNLFIAGGVGIGPLSAMVQYLSANGKSSSGSLIHCVRTAGHAIFADKLRAALPAGQYVLLSADQPISKAILAGKLQPDTQVYVSGSEAFISIVDAVLVECAHPKSQIHTEAIGPSLSILKRCC